MPEQSRYQPLDTLLIGCPEARWGKVAFALPLAVATGLVSDEVVAATVVPSVRNKLASPASTRDGKNVLVKSMVKSQQRIS